MFHIDILQGIEITMT